MSLKEWKSDEVTIVIDYDKCTGQAACEDVCPGEVYVIKDGRAAAENIEGCIQCCACVDACPEGAIDHSACEQ